MGGAVAPTLIMRRPRVDRIGGVRGVSHPLRDVARRTRVVQEAQSVVSIGQATAGKVPDRRRAGIHGVSEHPSGPGAEPLMSRSSQA